MYSTILFKGITDKLYPGFIPNVINNIINWEFKIVNMLGVHNLIGKLAFRQGSKPVMLILSN